MPRTLFDKIWESHIVREKVRGPALLYVDLHPWTFSCLGWLCIPVLPLCLVLLFPVFAWVLLAGSALFLSLILTLVAALRSRRPSEFTIRALKSVVTQTCCVALFCLAWKLLWG